MSGEWGSGKSTILNFVDEHLREANKEIAILRFNPWLISTDNDLVGEFLADLALTIAAVESLPKQTIKVLREKVSEYGELVGSGADLVLIAAGQPPVGRFFQWLAKAFRSRGKSVHDIKLEIDSLVAKVAVPVVVLIDEVDRIDDNEIRSLLRLIKSVADFPNVSYLVAYDANRVIEALGGAGSSNPQRGGLRLKKSFNIKRNCLLCFPKKPKG